METQAKMKENRGTGMLKEVSAWRMRVRAPMLVYPLRGANPDDGTTWQIARREPAEAALR